MEKRTKILLVVGKISAILGAILLTSGLNNVIPIYIYLGATLSSYWIISTVSCIVKGVFEIKQYKEKFREWEKAHKQIKTKDLTQTKQLTLQDKKEKITTTYTQNYKKQNNIKLQKVVSQTQEEEDALIY